MTVTGPPVERVRGNVMTGGVGGASETEGGGIFENHEPASAFLYLFFTFSSYWFQFVIAIY